MSERFIGIKQVLERTSLSKTAIYTRVRAGKFPRSIALGIQKVVWLESEIDAWIQARIEDAQHEAEWRRWRAKRAVSSRRDRRGSV